jgi:hypothetical protein
MHKRVNAKLRSQGQTIEADPPFSAVEKIYTERLEMGCTRTAFDGWEFLFSVAEGHPLSRAAQTSTPIAGHPPAETVADPLEQNRWNILPADDRWIYYTQFWKLLPDHVCETPSSFQFPENSGNNLFPKHHLVSPTGFSANSLRPYLFLFLHA